ncbi:MAG: hypothetical protein J0I06_22920 [Planctomycetes bacterium]|nr:hypothetical protein [Planctomycetota bacterium]
MRSGWGTLLAIVALCAAVLAVVAVVNPPKNSWVFDVGLGALFAGWIGAGVTAAVMLARGAGTRYGWAIERAVLWPVATLGLFPVVYVLLVGIFGWNN